EEECKEQFDADVYDEQVGMMEMVLDVDEIAEEMNDIRSDYCKFL
ncbi:MAG: glycine/sarcosine/betaine reductase complex selenoprotein A, partial [Finegoldia magna]|nr:glycine/sarcosine/betaine reductase complex selenoprotein A [Finegoldia magna]